MTRRQATVRRLPVASLSFVEERLLKQLPMRMQVRGRSATGSQKATMKIISELQRRRLVRVSVLDRCGDDYSVLIELTEAGVFARDRAHL